jgi:hypothetical protein
VRPLDIAEIVQLDRTAYSGAHIHQHVLQQSTVTQEVTPPSCTQNALRGGLVSLHRHRQPVDGIPRSAVWVVDQVQHGVLNRQSRRRSDAGLGADADPLAAEVPDSPDTAGAARLADTSTSI